MSEKEPDALRVPLLDLALVSEGKKKERPRKKHPEAGNKKNDGDNRVPQENKTMDATQIIEAQKKQISELASQLQQQQAQQLDPTLLMRLAQMTGIGLPGTSTEGVPPEHAELKQVGSAAAARMKALGPYGTSSLKSAIAAHAFGVPTVYKPIPSGWETASAAFGVGFGAAGGVLAAVGVAVATKLAFDALFGTTDPSTG